MTCLGRALLGGTRLGLGTCSGGLGWATFAIGNFRSREDQPRSSLFVRLKRHSRDRVKNEQGHSNHSRRRVAWHRTLVRQAPPCLLSRPKPRSQTDRPPGMPQGQAGECQVCDGSETWPDQRLRKVSSTMLYVNSSAIVPCCKCKIEIGSSCPSLLTTLLFGESSEKSAGWIRKKLEVNGGPSRKLRPSR